jgi:SAM-dependent methyltransferase
VDVGTGDGALLEMLAPVFERVIALDRSPAQLELAAARAARRGFHNVRFVRGEIDGPEVMAAVSELPPAERRGAVGRKRVRGADAVFAARVLHHAAVPSRAIEALVRLARPPSGTERGGGVFMLEYESHSDEALREQQADLWLGFAPDELGRFGAQAGLERIEQLRLPQPWCGVGADRHLPWQLVSGWRGVPAGRAASEAIRHPSTR